MRLEAPTLMASRLAPEHPALIWQGAMFTNRALEDGVLRTAGSLRRLGVKPRDVVAVWAANSLEWLLAAHALGRMGAILLPINTRLTDEEVAWQLVRAEATLVLVDAPRLSRSPGSPLAPLSGLQDEPPLEDVLSELPGSETQAILFTSGSTGRPKGVLLSWANQFASAKASASALGLNSSDRWLNAMPLFHVGGLNILFRCAWFQATVVLHESFEPARMGQSIREDRVTLVSLVPAMLRRLLDAQTALGPDLRAVLVGGAATPRELMERCPVALGTYGLTEACSHVTLVRPGSPERSTSGPSLEGTELRIVDEEGKPLPTGSEGQIEVRGPTIFERYLGEPNSPLKDGWFSTGDLGRLNENGCLQVLARRTDLIVSGGENVYPAEIEALLERHPRIVEAAVIAREDEEWGQVPSALLVLTEGSLSLTELQAFLEPCLARYKWPRALEIVEALPRLANGKLDRKALLS